MTIDDIETEIRRLREAGLTPKLIARRLGVPQSAVAKVVAAIAAQRVPSHEVVGCWVSPGWSRGLVVAPGWNWPDGDSSDFGGTGIANVLIAREHRHGKVSVCGYLVDVYCLGVKNAVGPRIMEEWELTAFRRKYFTVFDGEAVAASLELSQHLVLGAVDYARGLGFEPHKDFAAAAGHLGEWTEVGSITFGLDGKPFYQQGPYDNPHSVLMTLNGTVGRDNYLYTMSAGIGVV